MGSGWFWKYHDFSLRLCVPAGERLRIIVVKTATKCENENNKGNYSRGDAEAQGKSKANESLALILTTERGWFLL
jgi:hypothetical protein